MSPEAFLRGLDLDDLIRAGDILRELVEEKRQELQRPVWMLVEPGLGTDYFAGYVEAATALLKRAQELQDSQQRTPKQMRLFLDVRMVPESEYREWLPG